MHPESIVETCMDSFAHSFAISHSRVIAVSGGKGDHDQHFYIDTSSHFDELSMQKWDAHIEVIFMWCNHPLSCKKETKCCQTGWSSTHSVTLPTTLESSLLFELVHLYMKHDIKLELFFSSVISEEGNFHFYRSQLMLTLIKCCHLCIGS